MVKASERMGRYVVDRWFTDAVAIKGWDVMKKESFEQFNEIDLHYTISNSLMINTLTGPKPTNVHTSVYIEVKTRYMDDDYIAKYGENHIIKVSKYDEMMQKLTPKDALYYAVILNDNTLYVYDLRTVITPETEVRILPLKKVQYDYSNDDRVPTPCYILPFTTACKITDVTRLYNDYANIIEARKEVQR